MLLTLFEYFSSLLFVCRFAACRSFICSRATLSPRIASLRRSVPGPAAERGNGTPLKMVVGRGRITTTGKLNRSRLTERRPPFSIPAVQVPIASIGQEGIRCVPPLRRRVKSGAAPATVSGEPFSKGPLGLAQQGLGRWRKVTTREPGNLPERRHPSAARGCAVGADLRCGDKRQRHADGGRHG
jgi:hypothetical protein